MVRLAKRTQKCVVFCEIWYHLYQFKKREKHPWRSVTFTNLQHNALDGSLCFCTDFCSLDHSPKWESILQQKFRSTFRSYLVFNKPFLTNKQLYKFLWQHRNKVHRVHNKNYGKLVYQRVTLVSFSPTAEYIPLSQLSISFFQLTWV